MPTDEDVEAIVAQRIIASLEAHLRSRDGLENERMRRFIPLGRSLAEAEEDSPLIAMLLDDYYQRTLQAAPQSPTGEPAEEEPAPAEERMEISSRDKGAKRKRPRKRGPQRRGEGGSSGPPGAGGQS
jgi:ATP-dependent RNA helicase DeaD